jgi:hypothetical protein
MRIWMLVFPLVAAVLTGCNYSGGFPGSPPQAVFAETGIAPVSTQSFPVEEVTRIVEPTFTPIPPALPTQTSLPTPDIEVMTATPTLLLPTPTPTVIPSATPDIPVLEESDLKLVDGFNGGGGWAEESVERRYTFGYTLDGYRFLLESPQIDVWSIRGQRYLDTSQRVEILVFEGPADGYVGIVCRWQRSTSYTRFTLAPSGEVVISQVVNGVVEDRASSQISAFGSDPSSPYVLRADCIGNSLALYLNDLLIVSAVDENPQEGNFGLMAGTRAFAPLDVTLDNFVLYGKP